MTFESIYQFCSSLLASAGESAVRSIALALAAGLVIGVVRIRQPRLRLTSWTGVLYAAMMMPLLGLVLPTINVRLLPGKQQAKPASALTEPAPIDSRMIEPDKNGAAAGTRQMSQIAAFTARDSGPVAEAAVTKNQTAAPSGALTSPRVWS